MSKKENPPALLRVAAANNKLLGLSTIVKKNSRLGQGTAPWTNSDIQSFAHVCITHGTFDEVTFKPISVKDFFPI